MTLHGDLLRLASILTRHEKRRPKQSTLRRAISTAYYALFHLLVHEATGRMVRGDDRAPLRARLGRAFEHSTMAEASRSFSGGTLPDHWKSAAPRIPEEIEYVYYLKLAMGVTTMVNAVVSQKTR